MLATATKRFLKTLEASNLLTKRQLRQLSQKIERTKDDLTPTQIAEFLLREKLVTRWQAEMLLGGHSGFFFGRYKLLERLGKGGMGSVFKAQQSGFRRTVALKLMADELLKDHTAVARFHREIQSAAALNHPHIVTAYDADCMGDTHFLVMEHVDGVDLGTIGKQQPGQLPIGWVCECIRQAAEGLEYAHQQGMIHRDIKPANLLVTHREGTNEPWVKVLDMGLARFVSESGEETALTSTGQVMGTPDYVAPEQAQNARSADVRSDIFSLGCSLFRLLTGQLPYAGENVMEKLTARLTGSALRMRPFRPEIPRELDAIVGKMLERDPNRRFQTPAEVANALLPFSKLSPDDPVARPANRALGQLTVRQREQSTGDTHYDKFLDQLANEAAAAHDTDTIDWETQAGKQATPVEGKPGSRKLQNWIEDRRAADMRRWMWILVGTVALIFLMAGVFFWNYSGRTMLILDLEDSAGKELQLSIDGKPVELSGKERLEFPGTWGRRKISLTRPGYQTIEEQLQLARGQTLVFKPDWVLLPEAARKRQWAALEKEVLEAASHFGDPPPLRDDLLVKQLVSKLEGFQQRWDGKPSDELAAAHSLLNRLPLPADWLRREKIPLHELESAGNGDRQQAPAELVAVLGDSRFVHGAPIESMAISPDGKLLATTGGDYLRLFDIRTGRTTWAEHGGGQQSLHFLPDGRTCVGARGPTLRTWQFDGGRRRTDFREQKPIREIELSADGRLLAAATPTGVEIRQGVGGEVLHAVKTDRAVSSLAFSPDGSQLAYGGELGLLGLIDTSSGEETARFAGLNSNTIALDWHPEGNLLLSGHFSGQIFLWNPADGKIVKSVRRPTAVNDVSFAGAGDSFIVRNGNTISVWDTASAQKQQEFAGGPFALSADGKTLAVAQGGTVALRDPSTGEVLQPTRPHGPLTTANKLAVGPNGRLLASGHVDGTVSLWDLSTGSEVDVLDGGIGNIRAIAFSPDGTKLAVGGMSGSLTLWNLTTRRPIWQVQADSYWVLDVAFSPDGTHLAVAGQDPTVKLLDVASGRQRRVFYGGTGLNWGVAFSPDGGSVAAAGNEKSVFVWRVEDGELIETTPVPGYVSTIAFNPDGSTLAVGMTSGQMYLLETLDWAGARRLQETGANVRGLSFSANGALLADVEFNGTVHVWDPALRKGPPLKTIPLDTHDIRPSAVALTPEGRHLLVASEDAILVYRLKPALGARPVDADGPLTNPRYVEPSADQRFADYRRAGNHEALLPLLDRRIAAAGKAYDYYYRGDALTAAGQYERARSDYEIAVLKSGEQIPTPKWREAGWWVVGPYPENLQTPYPPEQNPDPQRPVPMVDADGNVLSETLEWQPATPINNRFDFNALFGLREHASTYALLRVYSEGELPVTVLLGSDDGVRLWVNGELVHENDVGRGVIPDQDAAAATLRSGWNTVLAKVRNGTGDHGLQLRLSDKPLDMARVYRGESQLSGISRSLRDELKKAPFDENLQRQALDVAWNLAARTGDDPEQAKLARELAELAASADGPANAGDGEWQVLIPREMSSSGGSTMVPQPDGSVFVTGTLPDADVYTLKLPLERKEITAIALEVLPDERLPFGSSGRFPNHGSFVINGLRMAVVDGERSRSLAVQQAVADFANNSIEAVLDDDADSYWSVYPRQSEPHVAIFQLAKPVSAKSVQALSMQVRFDHRLYPNRGLGRFRIWATTAKKPLRIERFPAIGRPLHPSAVLALAQLRTGDTAAALRSLEKLNAGFSGTSGHAVLLSACAHRQAGKGSLPDASIAELERWITAESLPEPFTLLLIEAINEALAAGRRDSRHARLLEYRAQLAERLSDFDSQLADYDAAIEILAKQTNAAQSPDLERLYRRRGETHLALENFPAAVEDFGRIIDDKTTDADLYARRAMAYEKLERWDLAAADLKRSLELDETEAIARRLADLLTRQWSRQKWPELFVQLGRQNESSGIRLVDGPADGITEPATIEGQDCRLVGRKNKFGHAYFSVDEEYKSATSMDALVEVEYWDEGSAVFRLEYDAHGHAYRKSLERVPLSGTRQWKTARFAIQNARFANSQNGGSDFRIAYSGDGLHLRRLSLQRVQPVVETSGPWARLAAAYRLTDDESALARLLQEHPDAVVGLADFHLANRDWQQAIDAYDRALAGGTTNTSLLNNLAQAHNHLAWELVTTRDQDGRYQSIDEGLRHAQKACESHPENGTYQKTLGVAYYRNREWQQAREALEASVNLGADEPANWLFLAMACRRLDDKRRAAEWYDKALAWREDYKLDAELEPFYIEAEQLLGKPASPR